MMPVGNEILKEVVKFLEICQEHVMQGKTDVDNYQNMTNVKLKFINYILKNEKEKVFIDADMNERIKSIYLNDHFIYRFCRKIVG